MNAENPTGKPLPSGRGAVTQQWSREPALFTKFNFGKHQGKRYDEVPEDYLEWMIGQNGMEEDKKFSARYWLEKRKAAA